MSAAHVRPIETAGDHQRSYLETLFPSGCGSIDLRFIAPDAGTQRVPVETIDEALTAIQERGEGRNVHAGIATRKTSGTEGGDGGKGNLSAVSALWVDLDHRQPGDREAFEAALKSFPLPPSMRVASGNGEHVYWLLDEPFDLTTEADRGRFELVLKGLADCLNADPSATDTTRVLRVPGTTNYPDAKKRAKGLEQAPCRMVFSDVDRRYPFEDFDSFEERGRRIAAAKSAPIGYASVPWDGELPQRVSDLIQNEELIQKRWNGNHEGLRDESPSGVDWDFAKWLAYHGIGGPEIEAAIRARRQKAGSQEKHSGYFTRTVENALAWGKSQRSRERLERDTKATDNPPALEDGTDDGLAERLVRLHGHDLLYTPAWMRWYVWDGKRYRVDKGTQAREKALKSARSIRDEAEAESSDDKRRELRKRADRARSQSKIRSALWIAEAHGKVQADPEELDANLWLLNVENGALNLRDGKLREHRREDRCTRLAPVAFDPDAQAPLWEKFLERILPDKEVRKYLQRAAGYTLTGDTAAECLFILYGGGANGKSTFLETLRAALGLDYAAELSTGAVTRSAQGNDLERALAPLPGMRLATTLELSEGQRLNEQAIKRLVSGEPVRGRFLYSESFEFTPTAKVWIATNHRPTVAGDDDGIWRRIRLVPFDQQIPEDEQNPRLREELLAELPGILAWMVRGCLAYQRGGLATPESIREACKEYRSEEDAIGSFLSDWCERDSHGWASTADLHAALRLWTRTNGDGEAKSASSLGRYLRTHGYRAKKLGGMRGWDGIEIKEAARKEVEKAHPREWRSGGSE